MRLGRPTGRALKPSASPPEDGRWPLARLANATRFEDAADDPLIAQLRTAMAGTGCRAAADRAELGLCAGSGAGRGRGDYDEPPSPPIRTANAASRAATGARYDRATQEAFVDRSIATYAVAGHEAVGSTSQAEGGLAGLHLGDVPVGVDPGRADSCCAHSGVISGGELALLPQRGRGDRRPIRMRWPTADEAQTVQGWQEAYLEGLRTARPGEGGLVTDKRPDNFLHVGLIKTTVSRMRGLSTRCAMPDGRLSVQPGSCIWTGRWPMGDWTCRRMPRTG